MPRPAATSCFLKYTSYINCHCPLFYRLVTLDYRFLEYTISHNGTWKCTIIIMRQTNPHKPTQEKGPAASYNGSSNIVDSSICMSQHKNTEYHL